MRRRLATLAAASVFALALGAGPTLAAGSPPTHTSIPATDLNAEGPLCGYTFASGQFLIVSSDPSTAAHLAAVNVVATDTAGASFKVVGSEIYNDLKGHLTWHMMFVGKGGGVADTINVVLRQDLTTGAYRVARENDTCHYYG